MLEFAEFEYEPDDREMRIERGADEDGAVEDVHGMWDEASSQHSRACDPGAFRLSKRRKALNGNKLMNAARVLFVLLTAALVSAGARAQFAAEQAVSAPALVFAPMRSPSVSSQQWRDDPLAAWRAEEPELAWSRKRALAGPLRAVECDDAQCFVTITVKKSVGPQRCEASVYPEVLLLYKPSSGVDQTIQWTLASGDGVNYRFNEDPDLWVFIPKRGFFEPYDYEVPPDRQDRLFTWKTNHPRRFPRRYAYKVDFEATPGKGDYTDCGDLDPVIVNMGAR